MSAGDDADGTRERDLTDRVLAYLNREGVAAAEASAPRVAGDPSVAAAPAAVEAVLQAIVDGADPELWADRWRRGDLALDDDSDGDDGDLPLDRYRPKGYARPESGDYADADDRTLAADAATWYVAEETIPLASAGQFEGDGWARAAYDAAALAFERAVVKAIVADSDDDGHRGSGEAVEMAEGAGERGRVRHTSDSDDCDCDTQDGDGGTDAGDGDDGDSSIDKNTDPSGPTPDGERADLEAGDWGGVAFDAPSSGTWPDALTDREQWMVHGTDLPPPGREKAPCAPWAASEIRAKWGTESIHAPKATADEWVRADPRADGWAFIQADDDPLAFVDGDDVRDPDTGEVHPAFVAILDDLGLSYADVSTSGSGVHAYYRGDLPDGVKQAVFTIDDEPWGANDDPPTVEVYDGKHVCLATGEHVPGTPVEVRDWDDDALEAILDDHGELPDGPDGPEDAPPTVAHDTDREAPDLEDYDPDATAASETTTDVRDVLAAVDRLQPRDLDLKTKQVGEDTGWEVWDPSTYRSSSSGESLHRPPREPVFHDFKKGESFGVLSLFAAEPRGEDNRRIISRPWKRLAGEDWWAAVDAARERGAPIPEYVGDRGDGSEPLATLSLARLDALDPDDARRYAGERGVDWPSTDAVRDRIADHLRTALADGDRTILAPPTGSGKSYAVAATPWRDVDDDVTGGRPVVHLHRTRETRDQLGYESAGADDVDHRVLLSGFEACPVAAGEHDPVGEDEPGEEPDQVVTIDGEAASDWFDRMVNDVGVPFSVAHGVARERHDQGRLHLPCCPGDQRCRSETQWAGVPTDDGGDPTADVVHATHQFAHVPSLRTATNVVLDERPDYELDLDHDRARRAVSAFLDVSEAGPDTYEELVATARSFGGNPFEADLPDGGGEVPGAARIRDERDRYMAAVEALETDPRREWYLEHPDAHTAAPAIARAVFQALVPGEPFDATGRASARTTHHPPRFDDDARDAEFWNREFVTVVVDDANTIRRVRSAPDFSGARAVVGLDAHPAPRKWRRNVGPDMTVDPVLDRDERRLWRVFERGLRIAQVGDADRPAGADGQYHDLDGDRAVLDRLRDAGFDVSTAIAPLAVESDVRRALQDAGASDVATMHYGEEKGRDDFAGESAGFVTHAIDPGDEHVLDWIAECGLDARPERVDADDVDDPDAGRCEACGGDGCRECAGTGRKRARGRGFVGPDADAAERFLASVRETHVLQSAGRYARDAEDPDDQAWVFVRTAALPETHVDVAVPGVEWVATDLQRAILEELRERPSATAADLADAVDASKEHVRQTLATLADDDQVRVRRNAGDHGAHLYRALAGLRTSTGIVDLDPRDGEETTNDPVWNSYTWSLAIDAPASPTVDGDRGPAPRTADDPAGTPGEQLGLSAFDAPPPDD